MNRLKYLKLTLDSYVKPEIVSKVIIVDFNSTDPITSSIDLNKYGGKVCVLRVDNQPVWKIGLAQNIGLNFCKTPIFLKIDSDVAVVKLDQYVDEIVSGKYNFIRGKSSDGVASGTVMSHTDTFKSVGGYNDHIYGWGYDDFDFYSRIFKSGKKHYKFFDSSSFTEYKQPIETKNDNAGVLIRPVLLDCNSDYVSSHNYTAIRNLILCKILPQNPISAIKFNYIKLSDFHYSVEIDNSHCNTERLNTCLELSNILATGLHLSGIRLSDAINDPSFDDLLIRLSAQLSL